MSIETKDRQVLDKVLSVKNKGISRALGENLIEVFGGIESMTADYRAVSDYGVDSGIDVGITTEKIIAFFNENKQALMRVVKFMAKEASFDSVIDYIEEYAFEDKVLIGLDGLNVSEDWEAVLLKTDDDLVLVSRFMFWVVVEQFCMAWELAE